MLAVSGIALQPHGSIRAEIVRRIPEFDVEVLHDDMVGILMQDDLEGERSFHGVLRNVVVLNDNLSVRFRSLNVEVYLAAP